MKPFDLLMALSGVKKVVNENGERHQVAKITLFDQEMYFAQPCNGTSGPCAMSPETGMLSNGSQLYIAGDKYVKYVNVYPTAVGKFVTGHVLHDSEQVARDVASSQLITVVRVEFEA